MARDRLVDTQRLIIRRCKSQINECNQIVRDMEFWRQEFPNSFDPEPIQAMAEMWRTILESVEMLKKLDPEIVQQLTELAKRNPHPPT